MRKPFYWKDRRAWYLRIKGDDGKLTTIKLADTKEAAYDEWDAMKRKTTSAGSALTVFAITDRYFQHLESRLARGSIKERTVERQLERVATFVDRHADLPASKLKVHHVTEWLDSRTRWGSTTRGDAAAALRQIFEWATCQGIISLNPLRSLKSESRNRRDYVMPRGEYSRLIRGIKDSRKDVAAFRQILIAMRLSGCRPSEILSLDVEDFDGETWTIGQHKNVKKQGKPRIVYLPSCLQTLSKIARGDRTSGKLFRPRDGGSWKYSDIRRRFERLKKSEAVKADSRCVLYSFRHTWITEALLAGIGAAKVAEMAGTSIRMIDKHYGHLDQDRSHLVQAAMAVQAARVAK